MAENGPHLLDGLVTHVVDPSNFFLRLGQDEHLKSFNEFEKDLISYCQRAPVGQAENINVGDSVIAKSCKKTRRGESQWRRATVLRVDRDKNKYDVFYMDCGNSENVAAKSVISAIPPDILHFPCICVPCSLAGIKPLAGSWTSRGLKIFEQLVKGKKFKVIILPYDQSRMHRTVAMYHRNNQRSIVHDLLEAEVGVPTGEDVKAHLNDIPSDFFTRDTGAGDQTTVDFATLSAPGMMLVDSCSHAESFATNMLACHSNHNLHLTEIYAGQNYESGTVSLSLYNTSQLGELTMSDYENVLQHSAGVVKNSVLEASLSKEEVDDKDKNVQHFEADIGEDFENGKGRVTCCSRPDSIESQAFTEQSEYSPVSAHLENTGNTACQADCTVFPENVIVPGFNLSALKQGAMSVEEMQEKQDAADMARRKAQLQLDLDACHPHLEEESACVGDVSSHLQRESPSSTDIYDRISQEIHSVHKNSSVTISNVHAPLYEEQQTEGDHEEKGVLQETASGGDVCKDKSISEAEECKPEPLPQIQKLDMVGEKYTFSEEEEYQLQKECRMILHEIKHGEDFEVVCAKLYSLVPIDGESDDDHVHALVEVLVEEAIKNSELTDLTLEILTSYTNVLNGPSLLNILRHSAEKYVKLPLTKSLDYHVQFASLLAKIVTASCCWPSSLRTEVLDFAKQCLEKWIIFNRKGIQTGAIPKRLEAMYLGCAESFLPQTFYELQEDEDYMNFILDEMRGKVLKCEVDYVVRSRLLELLIQVARSRPWSPASSEGHSNQAPTPAVIQETAVPQMLEKATQTGMSVITSYSSALTLTQEQGTQAEVAPVVSHDFLLDSFVASPVSSCSSVNDHNDSMTSEETDSNSGRAKDIWAHSELATGAKGRKALTSHGRAQRRQVLMEHLQGKLSTTTSLSNSPYLAPSASTCLGASFHENIEPSSLLMSIRQKTEETVTQDMFASSIEGNTFDSSDGQLHDILPALVEDPTLQADKRDLPCDEQILMLSFSKKECSTALQQPSAQDSPNVVANSSCQSKSASTSTSSHLGFADDDFPLLHAGTAHLESLRSEPSSQKENSLKSIVSDIFGKSLSEMQQQSDNAVASAKSSTLGEKDISVVHMPFSGSSENISTVDAYRNDFVGDCPYSQSVASVNKSPPTTWTVSPSETMEPAAGCKELNAQKDSFGENKQYQTAPEYLLGWAGDMKMADKQATQCSLRKPAGDAWVITGCDNIDVRDSDSDDLKEDVLREAGNSFVTVPEESKEMEMDFSCKQTDSTSMLSLSCGTNLLTSAAEPYPGECQPHQTLDRKRSRSSEVEDRTAVETSSCDLDVLIPPLYEKGDLAKYSSDGKTQLKKKKTKFRPLHYSSVPCDEVPSLTKWIPGEVICTNCGAKGHLRYDCSKPCQSILL